jgi:hypothetical protein
LGNLLSSSLKISLITLVSQDFSFIVTHATLAAIEDTLELILETVITIHFYPHTTLEVAEGIRHISGTQVDIH